MHCNINIDNIISIIIATFISIVMTNLELYKSYMGICFACMDTL